VEPSRLAFKASSYLKTLCGVKPNRRTGSRGNQSATDFFADTIGQHGYELDTTPFPCMDYVSGQASLSSKNSRHDMHISPYSMGCDVEAELVSVNSIDELISAELENKILLMRGNICNEQLMPKEFVFYNPEHHRQIISLLEQKKPAGIIAATEKSPDQVGALYPFPLILDGDFDIPNVYCKDTIGDEIVQRSGEDHQLKIDSRRLESTANNVIVRKNPGAERKILVTAHIDAYENSPGASDNASGTVVLLILAELLADFQGDVGVEIAAFNGEDHYSVGGQMDYLKRYGAEIERMLLAINIDDIGHLDSRAAYSFYSCPAKLQGMAKLAFQTFGGLIPGDPWFNGDHMIFVHNNVPSMAFTSDNIPELMATITHTMHDASDVINPEKPVELALALNMFIRKF